MNKLFFFSLSVLMLLITSAKADVNDLILDKTKEVTEKLGLSEEFLDALGSCSPKKEVRNEMGIDVTYEIKGYDTQENCMMENSSEMQGFTAISICKFDKEHLSQFIAAQKEIRKLIEKASSLEEIFSNPSYMIAAGMMLDEEICKNKHTEVDQTKELREHLKTCRAYEASMDMLNRSTITMKIVGQEDGKCHFIYTMLMKAPSAEEIKKAFNNEMYEKIKTEIKDMKLVTDCKFTETSKNKYIKLLEQAVIPAGDTLDFEMIQEKREAQKNALDYLGNNPDCQVTQK